MAKSKDTAAEADAPESAPPVPPSQVAALRAALADYLNGQRLTPAELEKASALFDAAEAGTLGA